MSSSGTLSHRLLLLGFLALPPVSLQLLQALDCVSIAEKNYLRVDTSIDCDSSAFKVFSVVDGLLIVSYLAIPLLWFLLLYKRRHHLNPVSETGGDTKHALFVRNRDTSLSPLRFLFVAYKPSFYFVECVEM
jgi:hypothetical protein